MPYKGSLSPFLYQLVGGLRAGMGYCGTKTIEELRTEQRFDALRELGFVEPGMAPWPACIRTGTCRRDRASSPP